VTAGAVVGGLGVVAAVITGFSRSAGQSGRSQGNSHPQAATAAIIRRSLSAQTQVSATLGNGGSYTVVNQATGTITRLPAVGRVVYQGQVLYRVMGGPAVLLYGKVPAYRDLYEGLTGPDVAQLNVALVKLGYATRAALGPRSGWGYFSAETAYAVEQLQERLGVTQTGTLTLGQAVFLPGAIQVTGLSQGVVLGATVQPGAPLLTASSTTPVVTINLDAAQQAEVHKGEKVSITLPSGAATRGVISSVGTVATSSSSSGSSGSGSSSGSSGSSDSGSGAGSGASGSATITVQVALRNPKAAGKLSQAPVTVAITTGSVKNALVVPVGALLAQPSGGYAVELIGPGSRHHLVPVTVGLFDDASGLVQVSGQGLAPDQRVVVPGL
jgi:hypothetical protein